MGVKKDIGKALSEKLRDQKIAPSNSVWERIEGSLPTKKRKKLFPLWMRIVSIGMLLLFIGGTGYYFSDFNKTNGNSSEIEKKIHESEKNNKIKKSNDILITDTENNNQNNPSSIIDDASSEDENTSEIKNTSNAEKQYGNTKISNVNTTNSKKSNNINNSLKVKKNKYNSTKTDNFKNQNSNNNYSNNNTISATSQQEKNSVQKYANKEKYNNNFLNSDNNSSNSTSEIKSDNNTKNFTNSSSKIALDQTDINKKETEKEALENKIAAVKDSVKTIDSLNIAVETKPEIKKKTPEKKSEWEVGAYVVPTIFGSIAQGSSLGEILKDNKHQTNISLSYRILANFKLSKNLTLRTGIGGTKLSTTTLDAASTASDGTIINLGAFPNLSYDFQKLQKIYDNNSLGSNESLNFKEEIKFTEIPVEVVYKFEKKKIDWKVFAGSSVYKISNNYIFAESSKGTFEIGQGNHYKQYAFSANLGGGIDYKVTKKFNITAEPIFKYYFSIYKREVYDYKPYSIGLSIGASYKF